MKTWKNILFAFLVTMMSFSCSTKKNVKSNIDKKTDTHISIDSVVSRIVTTDNKDVISDITFTPVDRFKPIIFIPSDNGGFIVDNAIVSKKDTKKNEVVIDSKEITVSDKSTSTASHVEATSEYKSFDLFDIKYLYVIFGILIVILFIFVIIKTKLFGS